MKLFYNLWPPFEYFVFILGPDIRLASTGQLVLLRHTIQWGFQRKFMRKKISKTILKRKMPGIQKIFKKCVYMYVCVCLCGGGPASDQGDLKKKYTATCIYSYPMNSFLKNQER